MLSRETPITVYVDPRNGGAPDTTTWGAFVDANDPETVAEVASQIEEDNYAEIGGGAAPLVWIFA